MPDMGGTGSGDGPVGESTGPPETDHGATRPRTDGGDENAAENGGEQAARTDGHSPDGRDDHARTGLATVIDRIPDAVVVINDERVVTANRATETELGLPPGVIEGWSLSELASEGVIGDGGLDRYRATDETDPRFEAEFDPGALEVVTEDSGVVRGEAHVRSLEDGRTLVTVRDVTERRRTEQALEALHDTAQSFTAAKDPDEIAHIACEAGRQVIGMDVNAVYLYDRERDLLEPAAATDAAGSVVGELPTFTGAGSIAWTVFTEGTERVYADVREEPDRYREATPLRSEITMPLGEFGVMLIGSTEPEAFADWQVSVARVLAADTARALDRAAREAELRARREELERQNDRLDAFASVVSHDLRNPLNVAAGNLELARLDGDTDRLDAVQDALDRAEEIVDDVLTMAQEGQTVESVEPVDLADLADECWGAVATGRGTFVPDDPPVVHGDRRRLRRILENLFANSLEHGTPDGDAGSHPATDDHAVDQHGDSGDDHDDATGDRNADDADAGRGDPDRITVRLGGLPDGFYVADDGVGIPAEERENVFDAGYSTGDRDTGLGLNIVREMVEAHGWRIRVTDSEAGGARFEITGVTTDPSD